MVQHKRLLSLVSALATSALASGATDCTLDYEYYRTHARLLAKTKPGARLDDIAVFWMDPNFGEVSVTIGGCNHLGLSVTSTRAVKQGDTKALIQLAQDLISSHWPKAHAKSVTTIFRSVKPSVEKRDDEIILRFASNEYDELVIIQSRQLRGTKVEVSAIVP